jgi:hypothetical protein
VECLAGSAGRMGGAPLQGRPSQNPGLPLVEVFAGSGALSIATDRFMSDARRLVMSGEAKRSFRGEQVAVRLEPELRRTIEELAAKERRSLSGFLHNIIADAVAAESLAKTGNDQ